MERDIVRFRPHDAWDVRGRAGQLEASSGGGPVTTGPTSPTLDESWVTMARASASDWPMRLSGPSHHRPPVTSNARATMSGSSGPSKYARAGAVHRARTRLGSSSRGGGAAGDTHVDPRAAP